MGLAGGAGGRSSSGTEVVTVTEKDWTAIGEQLLAEQGAPPIERVELEDQELVDAQLDALVALERDEEDRD